MKKIIALIGSPKKNGNTYKAVNIIEEELKKIGNIELSYIFLQDINLQMCRGCFLCLSKGENKCPIKDDRETLEKKMLDSDGVIFASPVYGMNVSALFKKFIDRFSYNGHRPRFFKQKALFVVTTGGMGIKETLNSMSFINAWGFDVVEKVGISTPPFIIKEKVKNNNIRTLKKSAKVFHQELFVNKRKKAKFEHYIHFISMRTMLSKFGFKLKESLPADYEYWTENGWLEKETKFFYDAKVNIYKRIIGFIIGRVMIKAIPKVLEI